ncbi:MAG: hypothetical protein Q9163_001188 [Psora crenata]
MSGSNVKGHSDLFAEARLPPGLMTRVTELGRHMKPLVETATGQSPYAIIECAAGDKAVEYIYEQYNEIVAKRSDSATQLLGRLGVNVVGPPKLYVLKKGRIILVPDEQAAIVMPTVLIGAAGSHKDSPLKLAIIDRDSKTRHEVEWKVGSSYCLVAKASVELDGRDKLGILVWKVAAKNVKMTEAS